MKPSKQSQSEAHRLAWRRLVNPPQTLPPETIAQLQWCAECLAEMGSMRYSYESPIAKVETTRLEFPQMDGIEERGRPTPELGEALADIELPTSPHMTFSLPLPDSFTQDVAQAHGLSAEKDNTDWNKLLEELEEQHRKETGGS